LTVYQCIINLCTKDWTFAKYLWNRQIGSESVDSLITYVKKHSPINPKIDGRIKITYDVVPHKNGSIMILALCTINVILFLLFIAGSRLWSKRPIQSRHVPLKFLSFETTDI
jgi:hypothetical protein